MGTEAENSPLYLDIHTHGYRRTGSVTSLMPDEYLRLGAGGPGHATLGIHPWKIDERRWEEEFALVEKVVKKGEVAAVGECGLDRRRGSLPFEEQREVFLRHIELAEECGRPLIIHSVRSNSDILSLRRDHNRSPWIIHGFIGNREEILHCMRHGIRLSPGIALLLYQGIREHRLLSLLGEIDPELLYLETDGVEVGIEKIYEIAARHTGRTMEDLRIKIADNFRRDFARTPEGESE